MRILLVLLAALPLAAAWNFNVLSGSHGAIASRTVNGTELTYIAYRDPSGGLGVSRLVGSVLTPETILATATPSQIAINIGPSGTVLITYWNGTFHWFAMSAPVGTGNCGPSANWICAGVRVPTGVTGVASERIVGGVDSADRAYFLYALRPTNVTNVPAGLYSISRSPQGVWTTPFRAINYPDHSPTAISVGTGGASFVAAAPNIFVITGRLNQTSFTEINNVPGGATAYGTVSSDGRAYCSAGPDLLFIPRAQTGAWGAIKTLVASPIAHCSVVRLPDTRSIVAYPNAQASVVVATSGLNGANPWTTETVDATSMFSKPSLALSSTNKLYLLYQANGYLKLARQQ